MLVFADIATDTPSTAQTAQAPQTAQVHRLNQTAWETRTESAHHAQMLADSALRLAKRLGSAPEAAHALHTLGWIAWQQGKYDAATALHLQALHLRDSLGDKRGKAQSLLALGNVYKNQAALLNRPENLEQALETYHQALQLSREAQDPETESFVLLALGNVARRQRQTDEAYRYYTASKLLKERIRDSLGLSHLYAVWGSAYSEDDKPDSALALLNMALLLKAQLGKDLRGKAKILSDIAAVHVRQGRYEQAVGSANAALKILDTLDEAPFRYAALATLSQALEALGKHHQALAAFKTASALKDSSVTRDVTQRTAELQTRYETAEKAYRIQRLETDQERERWLRYTLIAVLVAVGLFAWLLLQRYRLQRLKNKRLNQRHAQIQLENIGLQQVNMMIDFTHQMLEEQKTQLDQLLLNVLPAPVAKRLQSGETVIVDQFERVSVLFADIVGFTELSQRVRPKRVVMLLNVMFNVMDRLCERHGVEKIKTIGDCYMAAAGIPTEQERHCEVIALLALDIVEAMKEFDNDSSKSQLTVRVGIHTGPVVAGVIGEKKFAYDLWGDTVNTASRMESHGMPGKIHCSQAVYDLLHERFDFEERGSIDVKGKGMMNTWFLKGKKSS